MQVHQNNVMNSKFARMVIVFHSIRGKKKNECTGNCDWANGSCIPVIA